MSHSRAEPMRVAIYARVSTADQSCEMQLRELREYTQRRGWTTAGEYVDTGWSGAKASRPELDRLMRDASMRRFDAVLVWKLDRWLKPCALHQEHSGVDCIGHTVSRRDAEHRHRREQPNVTIHAAHLRRVRGTGARNDSRAGHERHSRS
jgi:hypothetical protein